ncbi:hypothetical protein GCM10009765_50980 [Fodinicola feengrottensis]|uniref:Sulfotransferase n=1 Tax=Fodinicola feengrottensis TaxID=435914 RepID=A0ABN2HYC5_9ACTN
MRQVTFVVGTGRAGSTALTSVLQAHPDVLSLSELWFSIGPRGFRPGPLDGQRFWRLLAKPRPGLDAAIRSGAQAPEILYPRRPGRFTAQSGIPAISLVPLPALSDDPDGLYDELAAEVPTWPERSTTAHWLALFGWFCERFDRSAVVERSGYSLRLVPALRDTFPDARFVHLFRNGPDCALSMKDHPGFRMIVLLLEMCERVGVRTIEDLTPAHAAQLPPDLAPLLSDTYDRSLIFDRSLPVDRFGALWSDIIIRGLADLAAIPAAQRTDLRYETLLADPAAELTRLADFVDVPAHPEWLEKAAVLLDPTRSGTAGKLPAAVRAELVAACEPGMQALGLS